MMKHIKLYLFIVSVFILAMTSCEDAILNETDKDGIPASQALNTLDGVEAILSDAKQDSRSYTENTNLGLYKQVGTDLVKAGTNINDDTEGAVGMHYYNNLLSPVDGAIESLWNALYGSIASCNLVIQSAETFETSDADQEKRLRNFEGEALTIRSLNYLELVRRWDNIALSLPLPEGSAPVPESPLVDKSVVYEQIINDCTRALDILPTRSETGSVGTASKGLANMILAEAYLDQGNYQSAAAAAEAVIADASYSLQPLDQIFGLQGGKTGVENNTEIIFSWLFDEAVQARPNRHCQLYVPLYDRVQGVARTMSQGGRPWGRLVPNAYYWDLFDEADGRLQAWHKLTWTLDDPDNIIPGLGLDVGDEVNQEYLEAWCSNDNECRYLEPTCSKSFEDATYGRSTDVIDGFRNIIVFRLSNAYLAAAEAHIMQGNTGRAADLLNVLRERAFGGSSNNFASADLTTLIEEQARELGHEGHRWVFLKRLGLLVENVRLHDELGNIEIQDHNVRLPIPQTFIDLAGVAQNPGY